MTTIGIILGSTRPHRLGDQVARWVHDHAVRRTDATFEVVDLRDHPLPHLEEPPRYRPPTGSEDPRIRAWSETVRRLDGFVVVTAEYNFGPPAVLKNALDTLYDEWNDKAVGFVSYGVAGGARAVAQLRSVCGALQMADVAAQVTLPLATDFRDFTAFEPGNHQVAALDAMLDQLLAWSTALTPLRGADRAGAA